MASHWYTQSGDCKYTILGANGVERDTNLKDARKLHLLPSVTTVIGQLGKPALENWKLNQMVWSCFNHRHKNELEFFKKSVWEQYKQDTQVYSIRGTEIHNKLEQYFKESIVDSNDELWIIPAVEQVHSLEFDLAEAEPSFAAKEGYGGKIDLILHGQTTAIIDFKTKQGSELSSKNIYEDYIMQLAAYRQAVKPDAECYNLLISVTDPGVVYLHKHSEEDLQKGLKMFNCLLDFWKLTNNYDSSFEV